MDSSTVIGVLLCCICIVIIVIMFYVILDTFDNTMVCCSLHNYTGIHNCSGYEVDCSLYNATNIIKEQLILINEQPNNTLILDKILQNEDLIELIRNNVDNVEDQLGTIRSKSSDNCIIS